LSGLLTGISPDRVPLPKQKLCLPPTNLPFSLKDSRRKPSINLLSDEDT
jgi:hypothetical protein